MTVMEIDSENSIYFEYTPPKENGVTFVFVNALIGSTDTWSSTITDHIFAKGNGALIYNFRGQAKSKFAPSLELNTELIVSDLIDLNTYVNPPNPVMVGLSIGGLYAAIAIERGIKSQGLVLINTLRRAGVRLDWINQTMVNVAGYGGTSLLMDFNMPLIAGPDFLKKMKPKALNPKAFSPMDRTSGTFKLIEGSLSADWNFDWSKIDIPALVITGHKDGVFRVSEDIDNLSLKMINVRRVEMPNYGHLIPLEAPEDFTKEINNFAEELRDEKV